MTVIGGVDVVVIATWVGVGGFKFTSGISEWVGDSGGTLREWSA